MAHQGVPQTGGKGKGQAEAKGTHTLCEPSNQMAASKVVGMVLARGDDGSFQDLLNDLIHGNGDNIVTLQWQVDTGEQQNAEAVHKGEVASRRGIDYSRWDHLDEYPSTNKTEEEEEADDEEGKAETVAATPETKEDNLGHQEREEDEDAEDEDDKGVKDISYWTAKLTDDKAKTNW